MIQVQQYLLEYYFPWAHYLRRQHPYLCKNYTKTYAKMTNTYILRRSPSPTNTATEGGIPSPSVLREYKAAMASASPPLDPYGNPMGGSGYGSGQSDSIRSPLSMSLGFLKNLTEKKNTRVDGQPLKRRGPKPDSKPALTRRQELNRQAQRLFCHVSGLNHS